MKIPLNLIKILLRFYTSLEKVREKTDLQIFSSPWNVNFFLKDNFEKIHNFQGLNPKLK